MRMISTQVPPVIGDAEADWLLRSRTENYPDPADRVTFATDWRNDIDVTGPGGFSGEWRWSTSTAHFSRIQRYTEDGITGGSCLRLVWGPTDYAGTAWHHAFDSSWPDNTYGFGLGEEFWVQFRFKYPAARINNSFEKFAIIANHDVWNPLGGPNQSSNGISHVLTGAGSKLFFQPYRHADGHYANGAAWDDLGGCIPHPGFVSGSGEFNLLPGFDRGPAFGPLFPTQGYQDRFCTYSGGSHVRGCPLWTRDLVPDEWLTFMSRIRINKWGGTTRPTNNEWDVWAARKDASQWLPILAVRDYVTGSPGAWPGFNGIWLTGRTASGVSGASVETDFRYDQLIVKVGPTPIPLPAVGC